jgi:hypothetical protein
VVLSPDGRTLYVTDTGCLHPAAPDGGGCTSANMPRTIYAFDVQAQKCGPSWQRHIPEHCPLPLCSATLNLHGLGAWRRGLP